MLRRHLFLKSLEVGKKMVEFIKKIIVNNDESIKDCLESICSKKEEWPVVNMYVAEEKIKINGNEIGIKYVFEMPKGITETFDRYENRAKTPEEVFNEMKDFEQKEIPKYMALKPIAMA